MVQDVSAIFRKLGFSMLSAWQKPRKIVSGFLDGWSVPQRGCSVVVFNTEKAALECFSLID